MRPEGISTYRCRVRIKVRLFCFCRSESYLVKNSVPRSGAVNPPLKCRTSALENCISTGEMVNMGLSQAGKYPLSEKARCNLTGSRRCVSECDGLCIHSPLINRLLTF